MRDDLKTKAQLISELEQLRKKLSECEQAATNRNPMDATTAATLTEHSLDGIGSRYLSLIDAAHEGIWIVDAEATTNFVNDQLAKMLGYSVDELLGRSVFDFVHEEDRLEAREYLERGRQGLREKRDFRFRRKDASSLWTMISTTPLFDDSGTFVGGLAMLMDVTDRKRVELALRESEAKLRALAETTAAAIFIYRGLDLLYVNPTTEAHTGYNREELIKTSLSGVVHPESLELVKERALARQRGEPVPSRYEFKILTKSGETRWVDATASSIEYEGGPAVIGTAFDITDRKQAEEALSKSQSRLQHVLSGSPAIIYSLRIDGSTFVPEWVSEGMTRLTGYAVTEALSAIWWEDHIHSDDRDGVLAELPGLFNSDRLVLEYRFQHKEGGYHWVHDEMRLLRNESGAPIEVIGSWTDVTERREAEAALRDSEERFRTLVSSMNDVVFTIDRQHRCSGLFGQWSKWLDLKRENVIGKSPTEVFGIEAGRVHEEATTRALRGERVVYEWSAVGAGGTLHFQNSLSPIRNQKHEITDLVGVGRDITQSKQAEEALRESQAQLQAILDNCPAMIFQKDLEGRYLQVNRQFEQTFKLSAELILGRTDGELFPPDIAAAFRATDSTVLEAGRSLEFEEDAVYAGGPHTYIVQKFPLRDATGEVYAVGGISTDITASKRAEGELRKQKEILQKIIDHIPVMIRFRDKDHRIQLLNQEWQRKLGWTLEEVQQHDLDILGNSYPDANYRQEVLDFIAAATGEWRDFKTRVRDGSVIDTTWANVRLEDGTNIGIGRDITAQKRAEEALLAAQARTESVLASVADTHILFDWDWRYLYANQAAVDAIGRSHEEILSSTLWEVYPDIVSTEMEVQYRRAMTERVPVVFDFHYETDDTWWSNRFYPSPEGLAVFATNITERKRAEEDLRRQKEILQTIFDHAPLMIAFVGDDERIKMVNHEWERTLGWSVEELRSQHVDIFSECYPDKADREQVLKFVAESNGVWTDFKPRVRDGRVIDASWIRVLLSDGTSIGIGQDITERKRAEEKLRHQAAQLAALYEVELEISAERELPRALEVVTRRAAELLKGRGCSIYIREAGQSDLRLVASLDGTLIGLRLKEGEGLTGQVVMSGVARAVGDYGDWIGRLPMFLHRGIGPVLSAPLKWKETVIGAITLARRKGEETFNSEDSHFLEQIAAVSAVAIHQATMFEELQETHKRLRVLAHSLIDAQEAERKRIARELHDRIGQALTALQINLQSMQSGSDGVYRREESLAIVEDALTQTQDLSLELRPSLLDDLGLVAALRWYVDRFARRAKLLRCFSADSLEIRLPPEIETACFRIAQEALTNVVRHAQATTVWVQLKAGNADLQLIIRDDGLGFAAKEIMNRNGSNMSLGLQGMRERASALAGLLEISSAPRQGTEVRASFPLKNAISFAPSIEEN